MSDMSSLSSAAIHIHVIALALAAAGFCWLGILAGLSRQHWFLRVSLLFAPLALLLPIRAFEPLVMLFPLMIALACSAASLRSRWARELGINASPMRPSSPGTNRWTLSLSDALLATTVIGVVLAVLVQLPWRNLNFSWTGLLFDASLLFALSIVSLCLIGLRRGWLWATLIFLCISLGIVMEASWGDGLRAMYLIGVAGPQHLTWTPLGEFYLLFTTLLLVGLWLIRWCWQALEQPLVFQQRSRLVGSFVAVTFAPALVLYMAMFVGPSAVAAPNIRNNALPRLVEIAERLEMLGLDDLTLREAQQSNLDDKYNHLAEPLYHESLQLVKLPGCVSLDVSRQANEHSLTAQEAQLTSLRSLAGRWSLEAEHAFRAGDIRLATEFDLAILRLGNQLSRGGIRIHAQAAISIKSTGLAHLALLRDHLPLDLIPVVINVLEALDAGEENPQLTNARDRYWTDISHGWRHRLETVVQRALKLPTSETAAFQALKQPLSREAAQRRLLGTELALRHYHEQHGEYPPTLAALVPTRLALLPRDPFTQQALLYQPKKYSFVLYSTGPDARDDGGKFRRFAGDAVNSSGQDWNLESILRFGWRPMSRRWGPGFSPRPANPPGGWTAPPWEYGLRRSRRGDPPLGGPVRFSSQAPAGIR